MSEHSSQSSEYIPIREWAIKKFGFAPCQTTLTAYAKNKQIYPFPVKFGGRWMCESNAEFFELKPSPENVSDNPLVRRIVNGS
ncbi:excisionase [Vibrio rhizosphaerae]|uniref:Excisionase n=1 Tax=Vibrio rhizosphaerae TaxID=398736 RepID=A0ABU4IX85_9VIBR|nr:excisionase [Vibrio rhizosphaerae]MDW6094010.1 excisionase [Vibrio rhizosphaerae]